LSSRPSWRAAAALAVGVVCIAWSAIFVRWAVGVSGPASAFYRACIASIVLLPIWLARRPRAPSRRALALAALAGLFFAFDLACYNTAILNTSAAIATLVGNVAPFCVGIATWLLFRERPPSAFWIGLAIAFVGVSIIIGADLRAHPTLGVGDLLGVAAGVWFAAYIMTTQRARAELDTLGLTTLSIAASALVLLGICLLFRSPLIGYQPRSWAALIGLGLVSQVTGYIALTYALGSVPATVSSVVLLLQAPLTGLLAVPLLGEVPSRSQILGGALVLAGVYVVVRRNQGRARGVTP
jgi:drug/metabolite transporter (DMT)-like permease